MIGSDVNKRMDVKEDRTERSPRHKGRTTREDLISATVQCMSEVGYFDTTTTLVAERAGVSRGALQYHFPTRQELLVAVIEHVGASLNKSLEDIPSDSGDVDERLRNICRAYLAVFQSATYIAQVQIWIGVRNDPQLHKKVEVLVRGTALEQDRLWKRAFAEFDIPADTVSALRGLTVSAIRGIALRAGRKLEPRHFPAEIDLLCRMSSDLLKSRLVQKR